MCATRPDPEGRAMMTPIPAVDKPTELPPEDPWVRRMAELLEEACPAYLRKFPGVRSPWTRPSRLFSTGNSTWTPSTKSCTSPSSAAD